MSRVFVCGDTHGYPRDTKKLNTTKFPEQKTLTKDDILIQLGDFGWIWYPFGSNKEQEHWLKWISEKNFAIAVVLGNHENYDLIETLPYEYKWGGRVKYHSIGNNKIYFFERGKIYDINGYKILAIGGATSSDKLQRTIGIDWWKQEELSYKEINDCLDEISKNGYKVDYILSHTCPSRITKEFIHETVYTSSYFRDNVSIFLDEIDNRMTFKEWHFGHLHTDYKYSEILNDKKIDYYCHYNNPPYELGE